MSNIHSHGICLMIAKKVKFSQSKMMNDISDRPTISRPTCHQQATNVHVGQYSNPQTAGGEYSAIRPLTNAVRLGHARSFACLSLWVLNVARICPDYFRVSRTHVRAVFRVCVRAGTVTCTAPAWIPGTGCTKLTRHCKYSRSQSCGYLR